MRLVTAKLVLHPLWLGRTHAHSYYLALKSTPLWWSTGDLPCGNNLQRSTAASETHTQVEASWTNWRWTTKHEWNHANEQRRLWRYTTRDDCVMQRGHELCNHLPERKLKYKKSALSVTTLLSKYHININWTQSHVPSVNTQLQSCHVTK